MTDQTEREALEALFADLHDGKSPLWLTCYGGPDLSAKGRRLNALIGLNAYLDAAMMLYKEVPDRVPSDPMLAVEEARKQHEAQRND